ncbi:uncharacterized protein LOC106462547 [Limulus polyphemus]|uniref:Uncharacterized protein LOC106462547 n=1 Tax=Limulus polyphemus TaxID=6850 RepID=A0ABM1BA76_LIMPO|nr:uncharacterized protein LOC106462547 [Limulus polyphemus]
MSSRIENEGGNTILHKLMKLPVVRSTVDVVQETYINIKHKNKAFELFIGAAESSVCRVTSGLSPLARVGFVRESLEYVDAGFCIWLDGIQRKHPLLASPTEKVLAYAKEYGEDTLSSVATKVFHVAPAQYMLRITDRILGRAEKWMRNNKQKALLIRSFRRTLRRLRRNAAKQRHLAVKNSKKGREIVTPKKKVGFSYRLLSLPRWILRRLGVVSVSNCQLTMPSSIDSKNDNFHKSPGAKRKYEAIESGSEDGEGLEMLAKIDEYVSSEDPDYVPSEEESTDSLEYQSDVEDEEIPATNIKEDEKMEKAANENLNKSEEKDCVPSEQPNSPEDQNTNDRVQEDAAALPSEE